MLKFAEIRKRINSNFPATNKYSRLSINRTLKGPASKVRFIEGCGLSRVRFIEIRSPYFIRALGRDRLRECGLSKGAVYRESTVLYKCDKSKTLFNLKDECHLCIFLNH